MGAIIPPWRGVPSATSAGRMSRSLDRSTQNNPCWRLAILGMPTQPTRPIRAGQRTPARAPPSAQRFPSIRCAKPTRQRPVRIRRKWRSEAARRARQRRGSWIMRLPRRSRIPRRKCLRKPTVDGPSNATRLASHWHLYSGRNACILCLVPPRAESWVSRDARTTGKPGGDARGLPRTPAAPTRVLSIALVSRCRIADHRASKRHHAVRIFGACLRRHTACESPNGPSSRRAPIRQPRGRHRTSRSKYSADSSRYCLGARRFHDSAVHAEADCAPTAGDL